MGTHWASHAFYPEIGDESTPKWLGGEARDKDSSLHPCS
jgi:hypothetical protein